mmetsp:Transcript_10214/g.34066  ORF Transcript_10214/g.34066 Transcript_10214/m.34066 type:complete len:88 (+) Transcript_10214:1835-2098(+)
MIPFEVQGQDAVAIVPGRHETECAGLFYDVVKHASLRAGSTIIAKRVALMQNFDSSLCCALDLDPPLDDDIELVDLFSFSSDVHPNL